MADLTKQLVTVAGVEPTFTSAGGGGTGAGTDDIVDNDGKTLLYVKNGHTSAIQVTITSQVTSLDVAGYGDATYSNVVLSVPASEDRVFGPFPKKRFDDSDENIVVSYDEITNVTVAVLQISV